MKPRMVGFIFRYHLFDQKQYLQNDNIKFLYDHETPIKAKRPHTSISYTVW